MIKFLLAFLLTIAPCFGQGMILNPYRFGSVTPITYLINQNFEGLGYDNAEAWTESGTGTMDEDYTTAPMEGSQGLHINLSATTGRVSSPLFTASTDIWGYFTLRLDSIPAAATILAEFQAGGTTCLRLRVLADGTLDVRANGGTAVATTSALAAGATYHIFIHYIAGTGANGYNSVSFSTDGAKLTSGPTFAEMTTGTATGSANVIRLGQSTTATLDAVFDKVRVSTSAIGDNPL